MAIRRIPRLMVKRRFVKRYNVVGTAFKMLIYGYLLSRIPLKVYMQSNIAKVILVIIAILMIKCLYGLIKRLVKKYKHLATNIREVDKLDGIEFEHYLCAHFEKKGYKVQLTPPSNDYGVDLVISKGKDRIAVQAKRYNVDKGYTVNYKAVQEVSAGKAYYGCNKGMVVTNSFFTEQAKELAKANDIDMWDRQRMIEEFQIIGAPTRENYIQQPNISTKYEYTTA